MTVVNKYLIDNQWVNPPVTMFCGFISIKGKKEKRVKKSPRCVMHRGPCYVESEFKNIFFYTLQLVTPSVVAIAVRKDIAICKIVFQVFTFIIFNFLMLSVKC